MSPIRGHFSLNSSGSLPLTLQDMSLVDVEDDNETASADDEAASDDTDSDQSAGGDDDAAESTQQRNTETHERVNSDGGRRRAIRRGRRGPRRSTSGVAANADGPMSLPETATSSFPAHAVIDPASNTPARAYAAILASQLARPPEERSYLLVRAESGWGNKVRALIAGFKLAIATNRIMLVDDAFIRPIYPDLFHSPFNPWLASSIAPRRPGSRGSLADSTGDVAAWLASTSSVRALVWRNKHGNEDFACWVRRRALGSCVPPSQTHILILETNQPMSELVVRSHDLRPALEAALVQGGGSGAALLAKPSLFDRMCYAALFGMPSRGLTAAISAAKSTLHWDSYAVHVGVHVRLFVDSRVWRMRSAKIRPGFWECVRRSIEATQAAVGMPHSPNSTLIFIASDKPAARASFAEKMAAWGVVRWYKPVGAFVNTRDNHEVDAIRNIIVDWTLLSDADSVVGTLGSSFTTAAALRSAIPRIVGSLRSAQCAPEARALVT